MKLIRIDPPNEEARLIWDTFLDLASELDSADWVLVGGLMVQLHAIEMGQITRPTTDVDLLGNARTRRADLQDKSLLRQFSQDELSSAEQTLDLLIAY